MQLPVSVLGAMINLENGWAVRSFPKKVEKWSPLTRSLPLSGKTYDPRLFMLDHNRLLIPLTHKLWKALSLVSA
jgi:hypothetical protein